MSERETCEEDSCFVVVEARQHMALLPSYIGRIGEGIFEELNSKVLNYSYELGGVVLSFSNPRLLQNSGRIEDEHPHVHFELQYTVHLFKPRVGSVLCGIVNNIGEAHVGCLVHNCFNASVYLGGKHRRKRSRAFLESCELGSEVRFCVTQLEALAGMLSIKGELCPSSTTADVANHHKKKKQRTEHINEGSTSGVTMYDHDDASSHVAHKNKAGTKSSGHKCSVNNGLSVETQSKPIFNKKHKKLK